MIDGPTHRPPRVLALRDKHITGHWRAMIGKRPRSRLPGTSSTVEELFWHSPHQNLGPCVADLALLSPTDASGLWFQFLSAEPHGLSVVSVAMVSMRVNTLTAWRTRSTVSRRGRTCRPGTGIVADEAIIATGWRAVVMVVVMRTRTLAIIIPATLRIFARTGNHPPR